MLKPWSLSIIWKCASDKASNLDELFTWLFKPAAGYHKLLLCTEGVVFKKPELRVFLDHLERINKLANPHKLCFLSGMDYDPSTDLRNLVHLYLYKLASHCSIEESNDMSV